MSLQTFQKTKTVVLTGASRGLGLASLKILLKHGNNVVAVSRTESPELSDLASKYPGVLIICQGDVSIDGDNKAAVDVAMQSFVGHPASRLPSLFDEFADEANLPSLSKFEFECPVNAGTLSPLGKTSSLLGQLSEYEQLFKVNFFSLISILTHALPFLKEGEGKGDGKIKGRVIMVSSGAATGGSSGWGAYSASKAAMNSLARTLGNEEPTIVTVAVRPGVVDTDMQKAIRDTGADHMTEQDHAKFTDLHKTGKLVPPQLPGGVLAGLALDGDQSLSGTFVNWDSEEMKKYLLE